MRIEDVDKNLALLKFNEKDVKFYNPKNEPFSLHGLYYENGEYVRLPGEIAKTVSEGVHFLSRFTAGGRIRFNTNSNYVGLRVVAPKSSIEALSVKMPMSGQYGFSVYVDGEYKNFISPTAMDVANKEPLVYDGVVYLDGRSHNIEIYFPLYYSVNEVLVGLKEGCSVVQHAPYTYHRPIVFYGSSITQGGCSTRAGNDYISHLGRWLDSDFINLGFSGNAKGEKEIAEYIASLSPSIFVIDYDHNAPTVEHLKLTHLNMYKTIREKHKGTPIVFISKPDFENKEHGSVARREVIMNNYRLVKDSGDSNVYFIDGETLFGTKDRSACTVDGCHPNDLGFYRMAETIFPVLKEILGNE